MMLKIETYSSASFSNWWNLGERWSKNSFSFYDKLSAWSRALAQKNAETWDTLVWNWNQSLCIWYIQIRWICQSESVTCLSQTTSIFFLEMIFYFRGRTSAHQSVLSISLLYFLSVVGWAFSLILCIGDQHTKKEVLADSEAAEKYWADFYLPK